MEQRKISMSEAQEQFMTLPVQLAQEPGMLIVTQNEEPTLAILPFHQYQNLLERLESLAETLEILSDEETMAAFRQGAKELEKGQYISWEDAQKQLGWEDL